MVYFKLKLASFKFYAILEYLIYFNGLAYNLNWWYMIAILQTIIKSKIFKKLNNTINFLFIIGWLILSLVKYKEN